MLALLQVLHNASNCERVAAAILNTPGTPKPKNLSPICYARSTRCPVLASRTVPRCALPGADNVLSGMLRALRHLSVGPRCKVAHCFRSRSRLLASSARLAPPSPPLLPPSLPHSPDLC